MNPAVGICIGVFELAIAVLVIAGLWKTLGKAGYPGWAAIIPIYNAYVLIKVAGRPWWWLLLLFIPVVNIVILVLIGLDTATRFGKGPGFGVGLALLGFIFYPILGFGDAVYRPAASAARGFPVTPNPTY